MALYPKIQSPCPYKGNIEDIFDGEICRLCKREVFDLTAMSDNERVDFMRNCTGEVCVRYNIRPAIAAAALAAAIVAPTAASACVEVIEVVMGGIKKPSEVQYVRVEEVRDRTIPALPVVYEDPAPQKEAAPQKDTATSPVKAPAAP